MCGIATAPCNERPIDRFEQEKPAFGWPLPHEVWIPPDVRFVRVTSQGFIHVDSNEYSVRPFWPVSRSQCI